MSYGRTSASGWLRTEALAVLAGCYRPIADLAEYEIDVWKPLLKAPFSTKEPDPMLRIARSVLNA